MGPCPMFLPQPRLFTGVWMLVAGMNLSVFGRLISCQERPGPLLICWPTQAEHPWLPCSTRQPWISSTRGPWRLRQCHFSQFDMHCHMFDVLVEPDVVSYYASPMFGDLPCLPGSCCRGAFNVAQQVICSSCSYSIVWGWGNMCIRRCCCGSLPMIASLPRSRACLQSSYLGFKVESG